MGYNYPLLQEHFYSIQAISLVGYFCPMEMTFREAVQNAIAVGKVRSLRDLATKAGISYDILKNISQGKSSKPNPEAAMNVAAVFGVSLEQFYRGELDQPEDDPAMAEDIARLMEAVRSLTDAGSVGRIADYAETVRLAEQAKKQSR